MLTFDEAEDALFDMVDSLPQEILRGLNCGVVLLPDLITDENDLLVLGTYHVEPVGLGRYVTIHYGSIFEAYGHLPADAFKKKLRSVLHHELVHHLENLAGDRQLEIKDAFDKARYLGRRTAAKNN